MKTRLYASVVVDSHTSSIFGLTCYLPNHLYKTPPTNHLHMNNKLLRSHVADVVKPIDKQCPAVNTARYKSHVMTCKDE